MRARMALIISSVRVEHREIVLRNKPVEMLAASAKGTVPIIVLADGQVIEESIDIMRWALGQDDPENWLPTYDQDLIAANDGPFKAQLDRYKYPARYDLNDGIKARDGALPHLQMLDRKLASGGYLNGTQRGFNDIALFPFIRQFANIDPIWFDALPLPSLAAWLANMIGSHLFGAAMVKHSVWKMS